MDEFPPLPERGIVPKGVIYRVPRPPGERKRDPDPEVLEIIRRIEQAQIREYFKRRRAS